jgi:hypothetical protein
MSVTPLAHSAAISIAIPSPWDANRARNWRKRAFANAAAAAGAAVARPYDLRHSFVSLLIAQGATVVDVARQAGHAPTMTLSTYAHLFDEFDPDERVSAEELMRAARGQFTSPDDVSVLCPRPGFQPPRSDTNPCKSTEPTPGIEPGTLLRVAHLQGLLP